MTRTLVAHGIKRRRFGLLALALLVVAALGTAAMNARAGDNGEPTYTVEPLAPLASYPDDVSATIKLRLSDVGDRQVQGGWRRGGPSAPNGTQIIHVRDFDNVLMARITFEDQAIVSWHTHPGPVIVTVAEGAVTITNESDCVPRVYETGEGFVDPGHGNIHMAQANGEAVVYATFFEVPDGGPATVFVDDSVCT